MGPRSPRRRAAPTGAGEEVEHEPPSLTELVDRHQTAIWLRRLSLKGTHLDPAAVAEVAKSWLGCPIVLLDAAVLRVPTRRAEPVR